MKIEHEIYESLPPHLFKTAPVFCTPSDFPGDSSSTARLKAQTVKLYVEHDGDWAKVRRDRRGVSRQTIWKYFKCRRFREMIARADFEIVLVARSALLDVMQGTDEQAKLKAALYWLNGHPSSLSLFTAAP